MAINGAFQSAIFPGSMSTLSNWIPQNRRGILVGLWTSSANVGNVSGFFLAEKFTNTWHIKWQFAIIIVSMFIFTAGVLILKYLKPHPQDVGVDINEEYIEIERPPILEQDVVRSSDAFHTNMLSVEELETIENNINDQEEDDFKYEPPMPAITDIENDSSHLSTSGQNISLNENKDV